MTSMDEDGVDITIWHKVGWAWVHAKRLNDQTHTDESDLNWAHSYNILDEMSFLFGIGLSRNKTPMWMLSSPCFCRDSICLLNVFEKITRRCPEEMSEAATVSIDCVYSLWLHTCYTTCLDLWAQQRYAPQRWRHACCDDVKAKRPL